MLPTAVADVYLLPGYQPLSLSIVQHELEKRLWATLPPIKQA